MAFVHVVHRSPEGGAALVAVCKAAGFEADCNSEGGMGTVKAVQKHSPVAIVIDLSRAPGYGRELGAFLRKGRKTRYIPLIYVDGEATDVARVRVSLPDVTFTTAKRLRAALQTAVNKGVVNPAPPAPEIVRFGGKSAAQKMGMKPGMQVGVIDAPPDYEALFGVLPEGVEFVEEPLKTLEMTLWFVHEFDGLMNALDQIRRMAARTRLWLIWQKGGNSEVTYGSLLAAGGEIGLALAKLCAVNPQWAALWLVPRKAGK